jgi:hypothetical protein
MSDQLKSAYELAMEKLARKERESARDPASPGKLSDAQKEQIARIRRETEAKLAELEILFKSERREARGDPERIEKIEGSYRRDRERILSRQEERLSEVRRESADRS